MKRLLQIFLSIIPLIVSFSTSDPVLSIRVFALTIFLAIVLLLFIIKQKSLYKDIVFHPAMIFYFVCIIAYLLSAFSNGFGSESIFIILKMFLFYVFAIISSHVILEYGIKDFLNPLLFFSVVLSVLYFIQVLDFYTGIFSFEQIEKTNIEFNKLSSTMANINLLVSVQFLILPFIIYLYTISEKQYKIISVISIFLFSVILLLTQTRTVFLSLIVFSMIVIIMNRKKIQLKHYLIIFLVFLFTILSSYIILKTSNRYDVFVQKIESVFTFSESGRYKLYSSTIEMIQENPIFGVGAGNWKVEVWDYDLYHENMGTSFAQRPHNDFLWVFAEGGILAFISYVLVFLILIRDAYSLYRDSSKEDKFLFSLLFSVIIGYGIISFFDFPIERVAHNIVFMILLSIIVVNKQVVGTKKRVSDLYKFFLLLGICFAMYVSFNRYSSEIHTRNAIDYKDAGRNRHVIKSINKAYIPNYYEMDNTSTPLLWYRGVAYFNLQRYDLALQDFKASYMVNPYHVHVLNNLATSYEMKRNHEKAKEYYNKVFNINYTFKEARVNLSAILYNEKEYEQALDVILLSKVHPYWKRKKENDNYDKYLKIIVNSWASSLIDLSEESTKRIKNILNSFDKNPDFAEKKMREVKSTRDLLGISYLESLVKTYNK